MIKTTPAVFLPLFLSFGSFPADINKTRPTIAKRTEAITVINTIILFPLNHFSEHSMSVTVRTDHSMSLPSESHGYTLFRIKLYNFHTVRCDIGNERYIVVFIHRMLHHNMVLIVYRLDTDQMIPVSFLRLLFWQSDTTAGKASRTDRCNNITTYRANVKLNFFHIT